YEWILTLNCGETELLLQRVSAGGDTTCTILFRTAESPRWLTECTSSLRMRFERWVSAVLTLNPSATATSFVLFPYASSWTTSRSREVKTSLGAGWFGPPFR